jgi:hypothetical protein
VTVSLYAVGEATTLDLAVRNAAGSLADPVSITLTVELPSGSQLVINPATLTHTSTGVYSYTYLNAAAGQHMARWVTTDPDDRIEVEWDVEGSILDVTFGTAYATPADYRRVTGRTPPDDAIRKLVHASELLDDLLIGAVYDVDANNLPTDATVIDAFRRAVCYQVEWEAATGDSLGVTTVYPSVSIGSVSLSRGGGAASSGSPYDRAAPRTLSVLRTAGVLPLYPIIVG